MHQDSKKSDFTVEKEDGACLPCELPTRNCEVQSTETISSILIWRSYPKHKPLKSEHTAEIIVAIPNPQKSNKSYRSTAPEFWLLRAMWLSDSFMSLEANCHFLDSDVKFFYVLPSLPPKNE